MANNIYLIPRPNEQTLLLKLRHAFDFAQYQVEKLILSNPDFFPIYTENGKWKHAGDPWTNWCEGFLGGMMWIFHQQTHNPEWLDRGQHYSRLLEERKHDRDVHDLGFIFWSTWKRWYDETQDPAINDVVITAGKTMGLRFKEKGEYLRSFVADESLFIDIMMNIGIVFYAAQQTNDVKLFEKALKHSLTTRRTIVRGDGSTAHEGIFDLETGEFLRQSTHQGWRGDSSWARGQAWALYGFDTVYRMTGDHRFLQTSQMCADYYLAKTKFDDDAPFGPGVPPNDWEEPHSDVESSAAAITASGLFNLSQSTQDPLKAQQYENAALTIMDTLTTSEYLADQTEGWEGILKHGCYHQRKGLGVDESVMWGEHFFVEALQKAINLLENENE